MHLLIITLFILSATYAEEISADIPNDNAEESILRVRSLPTTTDVVEKNWTSLSEALDVFSAHNLIRNYVKGKYAIGTQCDKDITIYLEALKNEELWALKSKITFFTIHCAQIF